jgi:hypothetical protein
MDARERERKRERDNVMRDMPRLECEDMILITEVNKTTEPKSIYVVGPIETNGEPLLLTHREDLQFLYFLFLFLQIKIGLPTIIGASLELM